MISVQVVSIPGVKGNQQTLEGARWDTALSALSNSYRRQLLVALSQANPQDDEDVDPLDTLSHSESEVDHLKILMFHTHLPKLEDMGLIEWEREAGQIHKGPNWEEIGPLLNLIQNHRDELPDDWL
jgi:hypothetical protein